MDLALPRVLGKPVPVFTITKILRSYIDTLLSHKCTNVQKNYNKTIPKQECIPVGCIPTAAVATTRFQYQGVYDVTSCLVPCSFQGMVSVQGVFVLREISVHRDVSVLGVGACLPPRVDRLTDASENITFPCSQ